jgi:excisionase family DNA binding protein
MHRSAEQRIGTVAEPELRLYYKPKEVCEILRISLRTFWNLVQSGELRKTNVGARVYVAVPDLEAFIASRPTSGGAADTAADTVPVDARAVRAWAAESGVQCPARGAIPAEVVNAYRLSMAARRVIARLSPAGKSGT